MCKSIGFRVFLISCSPTTTTITKPSFALRIPIDSLGLRANVVHLDRHVLAVDKPARVLSQGDSTGDDSLDEAARDWYRRHTRKPGNAYVAICHRLDRPVSGIVLFGLTSKAAARMQAAFREGIVKKEYLAVVGAKRSHSERDFLRETSGILRGGTSEKDVKWNLIEERDDATALVRLSMTGGAKKHQIRQMVAECPNLGPILGDTRYGGRRGCSRYQAGSSRRRRRGDTRSPRTANPDRRRVRESRGYGNGQSI